MKVNFRNWRRWAFMLTMIGSLQFMVLTVVAMFFYPGGSFTDRTSTGYSFLGNFFSDLGLTKTYRGDSNLVSSLLFTAALSLAGVSGVLFFIALPRLFSGTRAGKLLSFTGSVFGVFSGISYVGIAFAPADLHLRTHLKFVFAAFGFFFLVVVLYVIAIFLNKRYSNFFAFVLAAFAVVLGIYLWLLFAGPKNPAIQATGQKIVVYAEIVCMFIQGYGAWRFSGLPRSG